MSRVRFGFWVIIALLCVFFTARIVLRQAPPIVEPNAQISRPAVPVSTQVPVVAPEIKEADVLDDATSSAFVTGTVVNESGESVANATVTSHRVVRSNIQFSFRSATRDASTTSDADGRFRLDGLAEGATYVLHAMSDTSGGFAYIPNVFRENKPDATIRVMTSVVLSGVVVDSDDKPIAGARLFPELQTSQYSDIGLAASWVLVRESDHDGHFALNQLMPGNYVIRAFADGYAPIAVHSGPGSTSDLRLVMTRGGNLSGRVLLAKTREPLGGVTVRTGSPQRFVPPFSASTSGDGSFHIGAITPGEWQLRLASDAYVLVDEAQPVKIVDGETTEITLLAQTFSGVMGTVSVEETGEPVAGADVRLYPIDGYSQASPEATATSDTDGRYVIKTNKSGSYAIGVIDARDDPIVVSGLTRGPDVTLEPETVLSPVDVHLPAGNLVSGIVVDDAGEPVAQAIVIVSCGEVEPPFWVRDSTKPDGTFAVRGAFPCGSVAVSIRIRNELLAYRDGIVLTASGARDLKFVLEKPSTLVVTAVDGESKPIANVEVACVAQDQRIRRRGTDQSGTAKFDGLVPGAYAVSVVDDVVGEVIGTLATPQRLLKGTTTEVTVGCRAPRRLRITGVVVDTDSAPVPNIAVRLSMGQEVRVSTDTNGAFAFDAIPPGTYVLETDINGFLKTYLESVAAGTENVRIVLKRDSPLFGEVVDASTGAPVTRFRTIDAPYPDLTARLADGVLHEDPRGRFTIDARKFDTLYVTVNAEGYAAHCVEAESTTSTDRPMRILLQRGLGITGFVVDADNEPVANASVTIDSLSDGFSANAKTESNGAFSFAGIADSDIYVRAYSSVSGAGEVKMSEGDNTQLPITIQLDTQSGIQGVVTRNGEVVEGVRVTCFKHGQGVDMPTINTDAIGRYLIAPLPIGPVSVRVTLRDDGNPRLTREIVRAVSVRQGTIEQVDFELGAEQTGIEGRVTQGGSPVALKNIAALHRESGLRTSTSTDLDGRYQLIGLSAGEIQLTVFAQGTSVQSQTVVVDGGERKVVNIDLEQPGSARFRLRLPETAKRPQLYIFVGGDATVPATDVTYSTWSGLIYGMPDYSMSRTVDRITTDVAVSGIYPGEYTAVLAFTVLQPVDGQAISYTTVPFAIQSAVETNVELRF